MLIAMAYNLLKLNRRQLMRLGMDDILQYLQVTYANLILNCLACCKEKLIPDSFFIYLLSKNPLFVQIRMERSEMEDDVVIESLQRCMDELKKAKLDYPGPPPPDELPKTPFGTFTEPTFEQKVCSSLLLSVTKLKFCFMNLP